MKPTLHLLLSAALLSCLALDAGAWGEPHGAICAHPVSCVWTDVQWIWPGNGATMGRVSVETTTESCRSLAT